MYSEATQTLLGVLGKGSKKAVKRNALANHFDSDRAMRRAIENARCEGVVICNDQNGNGYYIADTLEEVGRQYLQMLSRAKSTFRQLKAYREIIGRDENQISIDQLLEEL